MNSNQLTELKTRAIQNYVALDSAIERLKSDLAEWESPDNKKKYSAEFMRDRIAAQRGIAKDTAVKHRPDIQSTSAQLEAAREAWSTTSHMRKARFVPVPSTGDTINAELLEELRRMRVGQELAAMPPNELLDAVKEAKTSKSLAMLAMAAREVSRRKIDDPLVRISLQGAVEEAVAAVEIPGQAAAFKLIDEIQDAMEGAEDAFIELQSGKETDRANMRRVMAKHAARAAA